MPNAITIIFPPETPRVMFRTRCEDDEGHRRLLFESSSIHIALECTNLQLLPVQVKRTLKLQRRSRNAFDWSVRDDGSVCLQLWLVEAVRHQIIVDGILEVYVNDIPVHYTCEHGGLQTQLVVTSVQPCYVRPPRKRDTSQRTHQRSKCPKLSIEHRLPPLICNLSIAASPTDEDRAMWHLEHISQTLSDFTRNNLPMLPDL